MDEDALDVWLGKQWHIAQEAKAAELLRTRSATKLLRTRSATDEELACWDTWDDCDYAVSAEKHYTFQDFLDLLCGEKFIKGFEEKLDR